MSHWYFLIGVMCLLLFLIIGLLFCIILFVKQRIKKQSNKSITISIIINFILLLAIILYVSSHTTYYQYNDWAILGNNIYEVEHKYGKFDFGEIRDNEKGRVGYYIYTDNGPILPDHLKHYYYIEYDECNVIYNVFDGCQPGG